MSSSCWAALRALRVILVLACVLGLSGADTATVGASARALRRGLHITNTDVGLLVTVSSLVGVFATLPFGLLADRVRRTRMLGGAIVLWGAAMLWSASVRSFHELLLARVFLGAVTASAGPFWACFPSRGRDERAWVRAARCQPAVVSIRAGPLRAAASERTAIV